MITILHLHVLNVQHFLFKRAGGASGTLDVLKHRSSKYKHKYKVGRFGNNDTVKSEGVVEIQVMPISTLTHCPRVRWCLEKALENYMDKLRGESIYQEFQSYI